MNGTPRKFFGRAVVTHADESACLTWPFATVKGYGVIRVAGKLEYVCRLVLGEPPFPGATAAHSCGRGDQGCVNRHHLSWKSQRDNLADRVDHGTLNRGRRNGHAKLSEAQVLIIYNSSARQVDLAATYGVSKSTIRDIRQRRNWSWLTTPEGE